jgi:hypothetical protein
VLNSRKEEIERLAAISEIELTKLKVVSEKSSSFEVSKEDSSDTESEDE